MKKLILFPVLFLALLSINAKNLSELDYVVSNGSTYYCERISFGLLKTKCILENGQILNLKISDIQAYKKEGKIFERMPVYREDKATGSNEFMELIYLRGDMKLFRYADTEISQNKDCCQYFVFRNGNYFLQLSPKTANSVLEFFNQKDK